MTTDGVRRFGQSTLIGNVADLGRFFGLPLDDGMLVTIDTISNAVYETTACGAYAEEIKEQEHALTGGPGVVIGSIVEGTDRVPTRHYLAYPFPGTEVTRALDAVEKEARQIWHEENCGEGKCQCLPFLGEPKEHGPIPAVQVEAQHQDWDEGDQHILILRSQYMTMTIPGSLDELRDLVQRAGHALDLLEEELEEEARQHDGDRPDDHPGFDTAFLT